MQLLTGLLGWILRSYIFQTEDGNDDWALLKDPANFDLKGASNLYLTGFQV
jgi:hypothetical protein